MSEFNHTTEASAAFCIRCTSQISVQETVMPTSYVFGSSPITISIIAPQHTLDNTTYTCSLLFPCKLSLIALIVKTGNVNPKSIPNNLIKKIIHSPSLLKSVIKRTDNNAKLQRIKCVTGMPNNKSTFSYFRVAHCTGKQTK